MEQGSILIFPTKTISVRYESFPLITEMFWWSGNCITFSSRPIFLVSSYLPVTTSLLLSRYLSCPVLIISSSSLFFPILNVVFHPYSSNIFYLPLPCHHFLSFLFYLFYPSLTLLCHFPSPCWIYMLFLFLSVSPFEHYTAVKDSKTESSAEKSHRGFGLKQKYHLSAYTTGKSLFFILPDWRPAQEYKQSSCELPN